jgi:cytochrome c553
MAFRGSLDMEGRKPASRGGAAGQIQSGLVVLFLAVLAWAGGPARAPAADPTAEQVEFFEKRVRPVLAANCHACHSRKTKQKGNLVLDSRAGLLKGGDTGPAVAPGDPGRSLLVKAIGYADEPRMPPRGKLPDGQIADLRAWVEMGAPWPKEAEAGPAAVAAFDLAARRKHWSLQPLGEAAPPAVKDAAWPRNPVDRFVLARLEAAGLAPAPPADRRALLRRVTFDLTGLPPTPEEVDAFLRDPSPDAYERAVERLLASPAYGERWARHWLDLVRFAETSGHEFDPDISEAHGYRDYVIRAFNTDVPHDQFVLEHVAGDLLPEPRRHPAERLNESILGTGFWFLGESKHSPVEIRADGADRRDNQIDVFGKTFLGLTLACARCHDHKFDAVSTRDYYALAGYLQSSRYQRAFLDDPAVFAEPVRRLRQLRAEATALAVARSAAELDRRLAGLADALLAAAEDGEPSRKTLLAAARHNAGHPFAPWLALGDPAVRAPEKFAERRRRLAADRKARAARSAEAEARAVVFADFRRDGYRDWFVTGHAFGDGPSGVGDVVLRPDDPVPVRHLVGPGVAHSDLVSGRLQGALRSQTFTITKKHVLYHVAGKGGRVNLIIDGYQHLRTPIYGGLTFTADHGDRFAWHVQDVSMWLGLRAYVEVLDDGPGHVAVDRILFSDEGPPPEPPNGLLTRLLDDDTVTDAAGLARRYQALLRDVVGQWRDGRLAAAPDVADRVALLNALLEPDALPAGPSPPADSHAADRNRLLALMQQAAALEAGLPEPRRGLAMADGTGVDERVHVRGSHKILGEEVPRRFLEALAGVDQPAPASGSGRLELARRLAAPSDPLVPRVLVNRLWHHHFGAGIVASPDDFGVQGAQPTHPELLDWLAGEFVRSGWSVKHMHRLLVLSSTYRMASRPDVAADAADPQNKLLHRMPVRRLEAEAIRDAMLAASGRLDRRMYGRGPAPYLTEFMVGRGRPTASGPLDGDGRRSLYLNVRRNFLNPMFLAFDYPIPFTTMGRRGASSVPAQALALWNNPLGAQQAQRWAARVLAEPGRAPAERVREMYLTAYGRPPADAELADALAFLAEQGKEYGGPGDVRAWADLAHVLFNGKEFIFVN